jgi:O-antigen ligase
MGCLMILFPVRGKWLAAALGTAVIVTIYLLPMRAAPLAMAVGAGAFAWAWVSPQRGPRLMALLTIVLIGVTPLIAYQVTRPETVGIEKRALPGSWQHRVEIWHYAAQKIAEKPLLGWGFDASRTLGGTTQFVLEQPDGAKITFPGVSLLPLHPHNGILQVWLEMGAAGALLLMGMMYGIGQRLAANEREHGRLGGAMASAVTASALSVGLLSFGLWQSWWQASLWLGAVLCLATLRRLNPR